MFAERHLQILLCIALSAITCSSSIAQEDALQTEILKDELIIRFRNIKPVALSVSFERTQLIRFGSPDEILEHSRITLPESIDPFYDRAFVPWEERDERTLPRWFNVSVNSFSAHRVHNGVANEELGVLKRQEKEDVRTFYVTTASDRVIHDVQEIVPGDTVQLHWHYTVPYQSNRLSPGGFRDLMWVDNWIWLTNWRIFFNGDLPIREQTVQMEYDLRQGIVLGGAAPDEKTVNGNEVTCRWHQKYLPGCINEPNIRPAQDLPHITVLMDPDDQRYWRRDRLSGLPFRQPHWLYVVRMRESRSIWWRRVARKWMPDKQNELVKDFINTNTGHLPDSLRAAKMELLHNLIAQDFLYENDDQWYRDQDRSLMKLGEQVRDKKIRDISRYDLYSKLISTLRADYTTAYVLDKRIGPMNNYYITPIWDTEFLFGLRAADGMMWMHPKRTQAGTLANEIPFYWQGTEALLVDQAIMLEDIPGPPLFIEMPSTRTNENIRGTEHLVEMKMDQGEVTSKMRVFLSGNFSTLGRHAYTGGVRDSTVDPLYGHKAYDITGSKLVAWQNVEVETQAPFRFRADGSVELASFVKKDDAFEMDLTDLFAFIVPEPFNSSDRHLPFYWDFGFSDHHRIELHFDRAIEPLDLSSIEVSVATSNSIFQRRVLQPAPDRLIIETRLHADREREDPHEMAALANLVRAAQQEVILKWKEDTRTQGDLIGP